METDPFPAMSDSEYSVIKSDVVKSFDCICMGIIKGFCNYAICSQIP